MAAKARTPRARPRATAANAPRRGLQQQARAVATSSKLLSVQATQAARRLASTNAARTQRRRFLVTAPAILSRAARTSVQAAAVATQAARATYAQSRLAHQNSALQSRIENNMYNHLRVSQTQQYTQAVAHTSYAAVAILSRVKLAATRAAKSVLPPAKNSQYAPSVSAPARPVRPRATRARKPRTAPLFPDGSPNYAAAASACAAGYAAAMYAAHTRTVAPIKQTAAQSKWVGDEFTPNCVVVAIANSLLRDKGVRPTEHHMRELTEACLEKPTIEEVLWTTWLIGWPGGGVHLRMYRPVTGPAMEDELLVIGYEAKTDAGMQPHAALSLGEGKAVSWGSVTEIDTPVEEAWELEWQS